MTNLTFTLYIEDLDGCDVEEEVSLPAIWEICYDCRGEGRTYLGWASKDQPAFTSEDFVYEGPDFFEDYMTGRYDAQCCVCKGSGKIKVVDEKGIENSNNEVNKKMLELYLEQQTADAEYAAECAAERRMGC